MSNKQYVAIKDYGGKYEVISKDNTFTTIIKDNKIYKIYNMFVIDYNLYVKQNKNTKKFNP